MIQILKKYYVKYELGDNPDNTNYQLKRQAYFNIKEIKTNEDYNSILISTPTGTKNLITNEQVKYPFFVIESVELPGHLLNLSKNKDATGYVVTLNPANKGGTEKFSVSSEQIIDVKKCATT